MSKSENFPQSLSSYVNIELIGKGGFGSVFKGVDKLGCNVAIKQILKNAPGIRAYDEIEALKKLNKSDNKGIIIKFINCFEDDKYVYIVMEYCEHGTLREYLKKNGRLDINMASNVLKQLVEGVRLMHQNKIMHRDLTASNVLISAIDKVEKRISVKLADFGLTKAAPNRPILQTFAGTPGYMAPQVFLREKYGKSADIFSLGAIFYSILTSSDPPKTIKWDENERPEFSFYFESDEAKDLLQRMMSKNEEQRIALEDILKHSFFRETRNTRNLDVEVPILPINSINGNRNSSVERSVHIPSSSHTHSANHHLRKSTASTEMNTQRTSRKYVSIPAKKAESSLAWPIKEVKHLFYQRSNKLGRFHIYNDTILPIRFEQLDENREFVIRIFEIYKYPTKPGKQKLIVYNPKNKNKPIKLYEESDHTKNFFIEYKTIRSREELIGSSDEIRTGYRRIVQFIRMAEARVNHCTIIDPFNYANYKALLKYDGTVILMLPDGRQASQTIDNDREVKIENPANPKQNSKLNLNETDLFKSCLIRLRQIYFETQRKENDSINFLLIKPFTIVSH